MKQIILTSFVGVVAFCASAEPEQNPIKLTGIVDLPGFKRALLEVPIAVGAQHFPEHLTLEEGQRDRRSPAEVVKIDAVKATVTVRDAGKETALVFEGQKEPGLSTNIPNPTVCLDNANFSQTLNLYAELKGRTVLRPSTLPGGRFSLKAASCEKGEAAKAIEEEFLRRGITAIPDGEKFVMVVPSRMAKEVRPHSPKPGAKPAGEILPGGTINLSNFDVNQALMIYGGLIGRKFVRTQAVASSPISFWSTTPLTKEEAIYAFDTLFEWNKVFIVLNEDDTFTAVSAMTSRPVLPKKSESN